MGSYAWYYHADDRTYYWTESWTLSTTEFAQRVSSIIGERITASDISSASGKADLDRVRRVADTLIYVD